MATIDIEVVLFVVGIVLLFMILAGITKGRGWAFLGTLASLVFTAYLATFSTVTNTDGTTTPVYPVFIISFVLLTIAMLIFSIRLTTASIDSDNDADDNIY